MPYGENYVASNEQTFLSYITLKNGINEIKFTVNSSDKLSGHNLLTAYFLGTTGIVANAEDYSAESVFYVSLQNSLAKADYVTWKDGTGTTFQIKERKMLPATILYST